MFSFEETGFIDYFYGPFATVSKNIVKKTYPQSSALTLWVFTLTLSSQFQSMTFLHWIRMNIPSEYQLDFSCSVIQYVVSLAVRSYHCVLEGRQECWKLPVLLGGLCYLISQQQERIIHPVWFILFYVVGVTWGVSLEWEGLKSSQV